MTTRRRNTGLGVIAAGIAVCWLPIFYLACGTQTPGGGGLQGPAGPQGPAGDMGTTGSMGAMGATGSPGADGQLRIYGNGSAGAHTASADEDWDGAPPTNLMFTDFTVNAGVTVSIPSGVVIRCTGTFTNNGTIEGGGGGARGGDLDGTAAGSVQFALKLADSGVSATAAGVPEFGDNTQSRRGGRNGVGIDTLQGRFLLHPGVKAGGSGMGITGGGNGGESITILAKTAVMNGASGTITVNGSSPGSVGGGGGAGGVIILASMGSVTNNGNLSARGGNGGPSGTNAGPGGGGGGGIINLLAPVVTQGGGATTNVTGGTAGSTAVQINTTPRFGGGGGGACRGGGGDGGTVPAGATVTSGVAEDGLNGEVYINTLDPTPLF